MQGSLSKELVSDTGMSTQSKADPWSEPPPDYHCKNPHSTTAISPLQKVHTYQIPLVDRSLNQSLSYPPPPPPSPGCPLQPTPPDSPASREVEGCFVLPSPCPPGVATVSRPEDQEECVSTENPPGTEALEGVPAPCGTTNSSPADQPTEPAASASDPVPPGEAPPPPAATHPTEPEVASQPLPQYPPQIPVTQFQQLAPAQPIVVTQQVYT